MKTYTVTGGGGLKLHVQETGNPNGKPILFIHGFSQCRLAWNKQLHSDLADDFRLVALDLRGHGLSEAPRDVYGDAQLWADDVHAVLTTLGLAHPVLSGWSYGGVIISDYVQHYGEAHIAGTNWVGAVSRLGDPLLQAGFLGADFVATIPGVFAEHVGESVAALQKLLRLCVYAEPSPEDFYFFLGYNMIVPPYVRQGLFARQVNNDAIIATMRTPMLLSYGEQDLIVLPRMGQHIAGLARHARLSLYPQVGHAPFWEAPERFNRELREFRDSV
jgi:pimeloyl-ACP methyl ester carboxylesterase